MSIGLVDPENVVPSDKVPCHGPKPVNVILNCADAPLHIDASPVSSAPGICPHEFTVTSVESVVIEQPFSFVTVTA